MGDPIGQIPSLEWQEERSEDFLHTLCEVNRHSAILMGETYTLDCASSPRQPENISYDIPDIYKAICVTHLVSRLRH